MNENILERRRKTIIFFLIIIYLSFLKKKRHGRPGNGAAIPISFCWFSEKTIDKYTVTGVEQVNIQ